MMSAEVTRVNAKATEAIYDNKVASEPSSPLQGLISEVLKYDPDVVRMAMGEVGVHIRAFADVADLHHPNLYDIAEGRLHDTEFAKVSLELLDLASRSAEKGHRRIPIHFPKILAKCEDHGFVSLRITDPEKNACHLARYIKNPELRNAIRMRRLSQDMSLYNFYNKRRETWETLPDSFERFVRGTNPFGDDIDKLRRRVIHFEELGLEANAQNMRTRLDLLDMATKDQYHGFNRCPVGNAAIILAKSNGFVMSVKPGARETRLRITEVMVKKFKEAELIDLVHTQGGSDYQPRLYPAISLPPIDRMTKMMDHLDAFPAIGGKPLFDHFCVLMPSLTKNFDSNAGTDTSPKSKEMDCKLIDKKVFVPVLLGERDGKQYFIDYWSSGPLTFGR